MITIMKKHVIIALVLAIILSAIIPFGSNSVSAQTNTALITQLKAQVAKLQTVLRSLTTPSIFSLNNQIAVKIGRVSTTELESLLDQRKAMMLNLAKTNPRLFLTQKLSPTVIQQIPLELRTNIEQNVSLTGRLEVIHVDDFENPANSRFDYSLVVGSDKYALYPTGPIISASGAVLAVNGSRLGKILAVETEKTTQFRIIAPAPPPDSVGEQKTLILLINFLDSGPPPKTPAEIYDLTFNGQFQKFYAEQSYGKISFSGDVKGWYTLPRNQLVNGSCLSSNDAPFGNNMIAQLILDNNIDLSPYGRLVMVVNSSCASSYSYVGKSPFLIGDRNFNLSVSEVAVASGIFSGVDFSSQWMGGDSLGHPFSWTPWDFVLSHEMGHSLGVWHANGWDCGENVLRGDCQHIEYGNYFDTMGKGFYSLHFNSFYKELLGWISSTETIQISNSGRYTLNPLELSSDKYPKRLAKIQSPLATSTTLYLEYRRGIGFDGELSDPTDPKLFPNQNGLFVNQIIYPSPEKPYTFPRLLDMQPTTDSWHDDVPLVTFNSTTTKFTDVESGISLGSIVTVNDSSITFDVGITKPQCVRSSPVINVFSFPPTVTIGGFGSIYVSYSNGDSDSCDSSNFRIVTSLPANWHPTISPNGDVSVYPNFTAIAGVNYIIPVGIPTGPYSITVDIINLSTNYKTSKTFSFQIINPPTISKISPLSGPIGTTITISGANFSSSPQLFFLPATWNLPISESLDGNTINFTVPREFSDPSCQCLTPILPGVYTIIVYANGTMSNPVGFEVTATSTSLTVKVITPNGGELISRELYSRPGYRITWQELNFSDPNQYKINLSLISDSGADRVLFSNLPAGVGYQDWSVPKDLPLGRYKLQVCVVEDSNPCAYSDTSDNYFIVVDTVTPETSEPIVPITLAPIVPIPIPPPTTTSVIISPVPTPAPITPAPAPVPTLAGSTPPHNAVMAQDGSGLGWKFAVLTFSSDLGSDWNNLANYSVATTRQTMAATSDLAVASVGGSPYQPIVALSRNISPGERIRITHKPSNSSICLGFLPGDVDQNGWALARDISLLNSWLPTTASIGAGASQPLYKTDINRDGVFDAKDVTRAGELMADPNRVVRLSACPAPLGYNSSSQSQLAGVLSSLSSALQTLQRFLGR